MANKWLPAYGGYAQSGGYNDVIMMGALDNNIPGISNVNLDQARGSGYGWGVLFQHYPDLNRLSVTIDLIGVAVDATGRVLYNGNYVYSAEPYRWYVRFSYSENNGSSYSVLHTEQVTSHPGGNPLAYAPNWTASTIKKVIDLNNLPERFTHIKFEVYGEALAYPHANIFERPQITEEPLPDPGTITVTYKGDDSVTLGTKTYNGLAGEQVTIETLSYEGYTYSYVQGGGSLTMNYIAGNQNVTVIYSKNAPTTFRPWAIRTSNVFRSLDTAQKAFKIRKSSSWQDVSEMNVSDTGVTNAGKHRIRKSGSWKGQGRIGT